MGQEICFQYPWAKNSVISTPGPRTLSSVPLGQELCHRYPWAKNSVISTPGPRTLSSVPLGQELCYQDPWAKKSVFSTPGPRTLSSVPLGQELCHQYPWARNSVFSIPGARTLFFFLKTHALSPLCKVPIRKGPAHHTAIHPHPRGSGVSVWGGLAEEVHAERDEIKHGGIMRVIAPCCGP